MKPFQVVDRYLTWAIPKPRDECEVQNPPSSRWSIVATVRVPVLAKRRGPQRVRHAGASRR